MDFINNFDFSILNFIYEHMRSAFLDFLLPKITALGDVGILWITITIIMLCVKRWRKCGIICALSLILCIIVGNLTLKPLFGRIRPFDLNTAVDLLIDRPTDFSFPSGHSMTAFAAATSVYTCNKKVGRWLLILAGLIAFSRLYLYVHYPTDVIVGIIIGILLALCSNKIVKELSLKKFFKKII